MSGKPANEIFKIIGKSILLGSIQFAIGSVEMSSKFSVMNFSKDQETLQNAAYALVDYMKIALIWTVGVVLILYASYGLRGAFYGSLINAIIMWWIFHSYDNCFKKVIQKNPNLRMPKYIWW